MSWLARLFGSRPAPDAPAPSTSVVIDDDLAAALTASGTPLHAAVHAALRQHLVVARSDAPAPEATAVPANADPGQDAVPFWLQRGDERGGGDIEDALRDRIAQRRAEESD